MSATIDRLHEEHRNMAQLLKLLAREVETFKQGGVPDLDLMDSIIDYNLNYPDACHHPKEDVVYARLKERDPDAARAVGDLEAEHANLHDRTLQLALAVRNIRQDQTLPRDWLAEIAQEFLDAMRCHMQMEEVVFFPAAERSLTDEDWKQVDARVFDKQDPVFDAHAEERYSALREALTAA